MLDIEKLSSSILRIISEPMKKLADRIFNLEKSHSNLESGLSDISKYKGLLENFSKHIETFDTSHKEGLDEIKEFAKTLIEKSFSEFRSEFEEKIFSIQKAIAAIPEIDYEKLKAPEIDYEKLKPEPLPDIQSMISKAVADAIYEYEKKAFTLEQFHSIAVEAVNQKFSSIVIPEAPKLPDIQSMVDEAVTVASSKDMNAISKSLSIDLQSVIEEKFKSIEIPQAPELPDIEAMVGEAVAAEIKALPKPKDGEPGRSITVDDVKPFIEELLGKLVAAIPVAKDGVGLAGALIDRAGALVVTLSDGKAINLGPVVGKDVDLAELDRIVAQKVAAIPKPKDGLDGLGFDDLTVEYDGQRTFTFKFVKGDKVKEFNYKTPQSIYQKVYDETKRYEVGDLVTWGGSLWHCNKDDTKVKPEEGPDWTLAVKRGRDGNSTVKLPNKNGPVKV